MAACRAGSPHGLGHRGSRAGGFIRLARISEYTRPVRCSVHEGGRGIRRAYAQMHEHAGANMHLHLGKVMDDLLICNSYQTPTAPTYTYTSRVALHPRASLRVSSYVSPLPIAHARPCVLRAPHGGDCNYTAKCHAVHRQCEDNHSPYNIASWSSSLRLRFAFWTCHL